MQPLNDDMDDLFRQAAEEYPLNTEGAKWSIVLQKLQHPVSNLEENQQKKDYKFLWLLLLLPLGFVCGRFIHDSSNLNNLQNKKEIKLNSTASKKTNPLNTAIKNGEIKKLTPKKSPVFNEAFDNKKNEQAIHGIHSSAVAIVRARPVTIINNPSLNNNVIAKNNKYRFPAGIKAVSKQTPWFKKRSTNDAVVPAIVNTTAITDAHIYKPLTDKNKTSINVERNPLDIKQVTNNADTTKSHFAKADEVNLQVAATDTIVINKKIAKNKQKSFKPYFYYSMVAGPDVSVVKFQKTSNAGYSIGIMLGYQVTKQLSIFTGALFDKKVYYTNGKYLDTSRLKLPLHSIILNADGYCKMIEIPVNFKYDFITSHGNSWFLSTGLSSYLMQQEDYNLEYTRYNTPYKKEYGYSNSSRDWFSILNISAGYQKSLSKQTNISISPYFKIPLKGIGIGKLPLNSSGIYFSVSRKIN